MATISLIGGLLWAVAGVQQQAVEFGFEEGSPSQWSETGGVVELRKGSGRFRSPRLFSDFSLSFDFRVNSPDTEAGVFIRSLTGFSDGARWGPGAYRIPLSARPWTRPASALHAVKGKAALRTAGRVDATAPTEWQHLHVRADGALVTIALNGTVVGDFEIEHFAGHFIVETRRGALQLRNVIVTPFANRGVLADGSVARPGIDGVAWPRLIREVKPSYTTEAMRHKIQGIVELEALILPDGSVGATEVKQSLDPQLDQSAIAAVRAWKFAPATRDGVPVAVIVPVEVSFRLKP